LQVMIPAFPFPNQCLLLLNLLFLSFNHPSEPVYLFRELLNDPLLLLPHLLSISTVLCLAPLLFKLSLELFLSIPYCFLILLGLLQNSLLHFLDRVLQLVVRILQTFVLNRED
jgi:hypothetical protein